MKRYALFKGEFSDEIKVEIPLEIINRFDKNKKEYFDCEDNCNKDCFKECFNDWIRDNSLELCEEYDEKIVSKQLVKFIIDSFDYTIGDYLSYKFGFCKEMIVSQEDIQYYIYSYGSIHVIGDNDENDHGAIYMIGCKIIKDKEELNENIS